jgi:hypothetical protein
LNVVPRYRLIKEPLPDALKFRNGRILLEPCRTSQALAMFAVKDEPPDYPTKIFLWAGRGFTMETLLAEAREGFELSGPRYALDVMAVLSRLGYFERTD